MTFEEYWATKEPTYWTSEKDLARRVWEASHRQVLGKLSEQALIAYLEQEYGSKRDRVNVLKR
jgi:hypothetical protein